MTFKRSWTGGGSKAPAGSTRGPQRVNALRKDEPFTTPFESHFEVGIADDREARPFQRVFWCASRA